MGYVLIVMILGILVANAIRCQNVLHLCMCEQLSQFRMVQEKDRNGLGVLVARQYSLRGHCRGQYTTDIRPS